MLLDFKNSFICFIQDRHKDIREYVEEKDSIYACRKKAIDTLLLKISEKDPQLSEELEASIRYIEYSLSKNFYEIGFQDGIELQKIAQPVVEIGE